MSRFWNKRQADIATTAVGLITEAEQAEEIIAASRADMIAVARGMLYDPRSGWHAAAKLGATGETRPQYWRAPRDDHRLLFGRNRSGVR